LAWRSVRSALGRQAVRLSENFRPNWRAC